MRKTNALKAVVAVLSAAAVTALAGSAEAKVGEEKAGPLMGNFKLAPAVSFGDVGYFGTQFAMELEIAYAVDSDNNAYLGFNPQFQFGGWSGATINLPFTFQYDIPIKSVKGLYLYPKINLGLAIFTNGGYGYCGRRGCYGGNAEAAFTLQPEFGVKYNLFKNFHVLGEPLSFPIYIGDFGAFAQWRFWMGCGFDVDP